jgi:hypothetical protein
VWGSRGIDPASLNTELYGGEWPASLSGRFNSQPRLPRCPLSGPHNCSGRCAENPNYPTGRASLLQLSYRGSQPDAILLQFEICLRGIVTAAIAVDTRAEHVSN